MAKPPTPIRKQPRRRAAAKTPPSRLSHEQMMRDIQRALAGREFADPDEVNAFLATLTGPGRLRQALAQTAPPSAREQAADLAFEAMEAPNRSLARKRAQRALALDPDCVDALVLLTMMDSTRAEDLIAGLEAAVLAGERALGPDFLAENRGHYWGMMETRPYMRARLELAQCLLGEGRVAEAIHHLEGLLELNPNDNQGVRDVLLGGYLSRANLAGARRLLREFHDDASATFAWCRVLERFLSDDLPGAKRELRRARRGNPYVEQILIGEIPLAEDLPDSYELGSEDEAVLCLNHMLGAWMENPAATGWLMETLLAGRATAR